MSGELSPDVVARAKAALEGIAPGNWSGIPPSLAAELVAEVERLRQLVQSACTCNLPAGVHDDFHANDCAWRRS